jgi:hypothetical protein
VKSTAAAFLAAFIALALVSGCALLSARFGVGYAPPASTDFCPAPPSVDASAPLSGPSPTTHGQRPRVVPSSSVTDADGLHLEIISSETTYPCADPIDVKAQLSYAGPGASTVIGTAGSGPVAFGVRQLDGTLQLQPAVRADCRDVTVSREEMLDIPFVKSGGVPDLPPALNAFAQKYFADPVLHLPIGNWEIYAEANYVPGGCDNPSGDQRYTRASVVVTVTP